MSRNRIAEEKVQVPIHFMEPSENLAREHFIHSRMRKLKDHDHEDFETEEVKKQLKSIREDALKNLKENVKNLSSTLKEKGIDTHYAESASDAASYIHEILKEANLKDVCINNSTVVKEIVRELSSEITVYDTYQAGQKDIKDAQHLEPWEVPKIPDAHLWESFDVSKIRFTEPLGFASLVGANSVSSSGDFFFVQHFSNISSMISCSKETILIVSLEKIVPDWERASFISRASGFFGLHALLLGLLTHDTPMNKVHVDELSEKFSQASSSGNNIHVIILDNGRSDILESASSELLHCINCRACAAVCPRSLFLEEGEFRTPRELVLLRFSGSLAQTVKEGLYDCSLCGSCELACPLGIPLPDYLKNIRSEVVKEDLTPKKHRAIAENVRKFGNPYGRGD